LKQHVANDLNFSGQGVLVSGVTPGSPASDAGLEPYDIILAYQGEGVTNARGLLNRIRRSKVGSDADISVWRKDKVINLKAIVGEANPFEQGQQIAENARLASDQAILNAIGIAVRDLPAAYRNYGGVLVQQVAPGSLADQKGVRPNDYIFEFNGQRISNAQQFYFNLVSGAAVTETTLQIRRNNQPARTVTFPRIPRTKEPTD
jgi:serine protease Do